MRMNESFSAIGAFFLASLGFFPESQITARLVHTNTECQFWRFFTNEINDLDENVSHGAATYFRTDNRLDHLNIDNTP